MSDPFIVAEKLDYIVVFKPRGMHGAPLAGGEKGTLLAWCAERFPEVLSPKGRKDVEGGLLHRLDRETEGLVVIARNQVFYDALAIQQLEGSFLKEYKAVCMDSSYASTPGLKQLSGFPPPPIIDSLPFIIESAFRPYGPGRRAVRPVPIDQIGEEDPKADLRSRTREIVLDRGFPYRTELLELNRVDEKRLRLRVRLARGFRHQVRCHLAWVGFPITGDELYFGGGSAEGPLSLSAVAVSFLDPVSRSPLRYECSPPMDSERTS